MNPFQDLLLSIYAAFAVMPFLSFVLIWLLTYVFLRDKKKSTRLTMDITTLFLIGIVSAQWDNLFRSTFGFWLIVLVILIFFGLVGGFQTKEKGRTDLFKVTRVVWRLSFVGLSALYIILLLLIVGRNILFAA